MTEAARHLHWGAEALWEQLQPLLPGLSVEVLAHADSTNTRLLERARPLGEAGFGRRAVDLQPCLLVAEHQTEGRGRQGRSWRAAPGASLTFSLALPFAPHDWSGLSLAVGVALAEALDPGGQRIRLKWPNDLWLADETGAGRKLGGILIETVPLAEGRLAVIGVGLNVRPHEWANVTSAHAALDEIDPALDAPVTLALVAEPLVRGLLRFQAEGFAPFREAFARRDLLAGRAITTTLAEPAAGTAEGVDESGALLVRSGTTLHRIASGEVSVRLDTRDSLC